MFFLSEPFLYDLLGGDRDETAGISSQNRVKVHRINGMQEENEVLKDELAVLPSPGTSSQIPSSQTLQVIRRPTLKSASSESVGQNFAFLTPIVKVETGEEPTKKGKDGAKSTGKPADGLEKEKLLRGLVHNDQVSDASSMVDDKLSISTKTVGTKKSSGRKENLTSQVGGSHYDPLSTIPEGFTKQTRWLVLPQSKVNLLLRFWAGIERDFDHIFSFQMVNGPGKVSVHCKATCKRPQISCSLKKSVVHPSFAQVQSQSFKKEQTLDFGVIPAGVNPEGFPGVQDSEHSIRLSVHNTGLFDAHVEFDVIPNASIGSAQKVNKQMGFFLHPPTMDLKIDEQQDLRIYSYPKQDQLGLLEGNLVCRVTNNKDHTQFKLKCCSDIPRVNLEPSVLVFERLLLGLLETKDILIRNVCALPVQWKITGLEKVGQEFTFSETHGIVDAMSTKVVQITFASIEERTFKENFTLQVFHVKHLQKASQECTVTVSAEAYKIDVIVKNANPQEEAPTVDGLNYGIVKVTEEFLKTVVLQNNGKYGILFSFSMRKSLSEIFTITPIQGKLEPKEEQRVEIHFNKERRLKKEVNLQRNQEFQLVISESHTTKSEQRITIPITIRAVYSKFLMVPEHGIHFGSQVCGTTSLPYRLSMVNVGEAPFTFRLSAPLNIETEETSHVNCGKQETPTKKELKKTAEVGKGDSKKGAVGKPKKQHERRPSSARALPETLDLKCFALRPSSGTINPNEKQEVLVHFKAEPLGHISDSVQVAISDCDPLQYPQDIIYNLSGDSCMPGIDISPETIFEEHHVVESVNLVGPVPAKGIYSKKEHVFSFGPVIIGPPSPTSKGQTTANKSVEARLKIENPYNVPCSLQFSCVPQQGQESPLCISISQKTADVHPLEYIFITCIFVPTAMKRYSATFEAVLVIKGQAQTSLFKFELIGEGTLPRLSIESPSILSPAKMPWLKFPRVLQGRTRTLPIVFQNKGLVTVTGKIKVQGKCNSFISFAILHGELEMPCEGGVSFCIPSGETQKVVVTFSPTEVRSYKEELQFVIDENPSEKPTIQITGEGYDEDVLFVGLPMDSDDELSFEDCPVGCEKSIDFGLQNKAADKHWRFEWPNVSFLAFSPPSGHLLAGQCQSVRATFSPSKAVQYTDHEIELQVCNFIVKGDGEKPHTIDQTPTKTDSRASEAQSNSKKEPSYEVVKGNVKVIAAKLHARADAVKYECSIHDINFKTTMMFQKRSFSFQLRNLSGIVMSYQWMVQNVDGSHRDHDIYVVSQGNGSVQAKGSTEIVVRFCPTEVEDCTRLLICEIPHLDPSCPPLKISLTGKVARPWCYFELLRSDYAVQRRSADWGPLDPQLNVIEFDTLGPNMHGMKYFVAANTTSKPYKFFWEQKDSVTETPAVQAPFRCLTMAGEIMSGKKYEMAFQYTPARIELHESLWAFKIPEQEIEVPFLLVGNIKKPALSFDHSVINFGQVLVGSRVKYVVQLKNEEPAPCFIRFGKLNYIGSQHANQLGVKPTFKIKPRSALFKPASTLPIEITFAPAIEGRVTVEVVCNVKKASPLLLTIKAESYQYHEEIFMDAEDGVVPLKLATKEVNGIKIKQSPEKDVIHRKVTLANFGKFPFQFLWDWAQNEAVVVEPAGHTVGRDERITCELTISLTKLKENSGNLLTCQIMHGNRYDLLLSACSVEGEEEEEDLRKVKY